MARPVAQQSKPVVYTPSVPETECEPTYEDLECCLITLRDALQQQRVTRFSNHAIATIDRVLPEDKRPMK